MGKERNRKMRSERKEDRNSRIRKYRIEGRKYGWKNRYESELLRKVRKDEIWKCEEWGENWWNYEKLRCGEYESKVEKIKIEDNKRRKDEKDEEGRFNNK